MYSSGLSWVLTLADDGLFYKTASGIHTAVTAVQEELEKVSHGCHETESEINPSKAQALWCTLNNKAVEQAMPAVLFNGGVKEGTNTLRHLGIHFDRMLMYRPQVDLTKLWWKKRLFDLKAMSNVLNLERVQNEATRVILGISKDTPIEAVRYLPDLPAMEARHKVDQVITYLSAMQDPKNPLSDAVRKENRCRVAKGKSWMGQAKQSIQNVCGLLELKHIRDWKKKRHLSSRPTTRL